MAKQKVTLTLDGAHLNELRLLVGARRLSAALDDALSRDLERRRHRTAVDHWLADLEPEHGAIPVETLEWATRLVDEWEAAGVFQGGSPPQV